MGKRSSARWIAATGVWNLLINRVVPPRWYVPANLCAAGTSLAMARRSAGWRALGLAGDRVGDGLRWGAIGAASVATALVAGSRLRATAGLYSDARATPERTRLETLVRIPLGTVVVEEILFRGILPSETPRRGASSLAFGAWHVLPTISALDINDVQDPAVRRRAVVAGVAGTVLAGEALEWLRRRSGSLVAPALTHWAANAVGYVLAASHDSRSDLLTPS